MSISKSLRIGESPLAYRVANRSRTWRAHFAREKRLMAKVARQCWKARSWPRRRLRCRLGRYALTKSALVSLIAKKNEIPRKTAAGVYATTSPVPWFNPSPRHHAVRAPRPSEGQSGKFRHAGSVRLSAILRPATMVEAAAKPASVRVKIRALSKLKAAASP